MHYSHRLPQARIQQIVGWFIIVPVIIVGAVLYEVSKNENLFEEKYELTTVLSEGYGLKPGQPVVMLGIQIGRIAKVEFSEQNDAKVTLRILKKYQEKVRQNSIAKLGKSGGFFGDPQIEITVGNKSLPMVAEDGHLEAEEPFNMAELLAEAKPMLETVKKTLLRVEQITQEVQATVITGHETLQNVKEASSGLPAVLTNVRHATATVRETARTVAAEVPALTGGLQKTLNRVGDVVEDVKVSTAKLPEIMDSARGSLDNVKGLTGDLRGNVPPLMTSVQGTVDDVNEIMAGAKKTFPISTFVGKARSVRIEEGAGLSPRSLRRDDLTAE
jgi:phospholipid/cholesterol/gamma-HCH transport system substrate-binding protein